MARRATGWTCQRSSQGQPCRFKNRPGTRKCAKCEKPRPVKKPPAHAAVLDELTYEDFIEINGGEFCWICRQLPAKQRIRVTRKYDRDHDHKTGKPRGLLCHKHNRMLKEWMTIQLVEAILLYLERAREIE